MRYRCLSMQARRLVSVDEQEGENSANYHLNSLGTVSNTKEQRQNLDDHEHLPHA